MNRLQILKSALVGGASALTLVHPAAAKVFNIPDGDLSAALGAYIQQSGVEIIYSDDIVRGHKSRGAKGDYTETAALDQILRGTGFTTLTTRSNAIDIIPAPREQKPRAETIRLAAAAVPRAPAQGAIETVVVTAQHKSENIQNVPIAVTALSQQQLTERQIAGGPDLLRDVPNMNFSKTNFTGYSIELRGIGTQAISVTTDPAVAVAFNGIPFIRNHFFEQEFYDLGDVEVLRGPQGTLYGRNATAGVVNLKSALPDDQFEATGSVDLGNYSGKRLEGMINLPIVGDKLDLRLAGEWTMRDGYSFDTLTNQPVDGRDLWSTRGSLRWRPNADLDANLVWEHFSENDDRMRTAKQLCKTALPQTSVDGVPVDLMSAGTTFSPADYLSQGCQMSSLYSADAFQVPYGPSLPYYSGLTDAGGPVRDFFNVYASTTQSTNLRDIETQINPTYKAKNDTLELNVDYNVTPALTFTSQTGYNNDFLWSTEDYNRFNTAPGVFLYVRPSDHPAYLSIIPDPDGVYRCTQGGFADCTGLLPDATCTPSTPGGDAICAHEGMFCDPQLGCSNRLIAEDLSDERAWQASQEFRLASHFAGPFNFSAGGNYLHYETVEDYYVFINTLTLFSRYESQSEGRWVPGVSDNGGCLPGGFRYPNPSIPQALLTDCQYIDPNPITGLNGQGHNYFRSQNPYLLNSYALFGEAYYNITDDLKLTGGLRWTDDNKHFLDIPSEVLLPGYGYTVTDVVNQAWSEMTGRSVLDWTPKLDFTDQTLFYASYAHGYKAGGANPPGAIFPVTCEASCESQTVNPIHPLTFKPEHIEAFELGTKNTLLGSSLTLDGDIFYYNYHAYQISRIVDRSAINDNFNAHVMGAELESIWEPLPGLRFNLAAGYENARIGNGMYSVDLMDRTAGNPNWVVVRPFVTEASNCVLPTYVVAAMLLDETSNNISAACDNAYTNHLDPVTVQPYVQNPAVPFSFPAGYTGPNPYPGFNPLTAPNNGEGFDKNLSGHRLPNAPPVTLSLGGQYTIPVSDDWAATLRGDFYYQADSWARVFNDNPYDRLHGYTNLNLALIFSSADGWTIMPYVKNVFNTTAITGDFLNSDDTGLTTNVFLTDPRLYGIRVTKNFGEGDTGAMQDVEDYISGLFADADHGRPPLWIELGGGLDRIMSPQQTFNPYFLSSVTIPAEKRALDVQSPSAYGLDEDAKISYQPEGSGWIVSAAIRYGRSNANRLHHQQTANAKIPVNFTIAHFLHKYMSYYPYRHVKFAQGQSQLSERHTLMDFAAGKDVGLGMLGLDGSSVVSAGVRIAQLDEKSSTTLRALPDLQYPTAPITSFAQFEEFSNYADVNFHAFSASEESKRSFHGVGPTVAWDASTPVLGNDDAGSISLDWGLNAAVLFGRQSAKGRHQTNAQTYHMTKWIVPNAGRLVKKGQVNGYFDNLSAHKCGTAGYPTYCRYAQRGSQQYGYQETAHATNSKANSGSFNRSRQVSVPDIGFTIGASYRYQNAKISFGYRADFLFGAMDGGIDTYKSETRGFYGPFATVSIGLGG